AYEISKLQIADEQRELAERVVAEGLDHKATAAEVSRRRRPQKARGPKGKGRAPAQQRHRGTRGVRVMIQAMARHTPADVAADLREIADRIEGQAAQDAA